MTTRDDLDDSGLRIERLWRQGAPRQVRDMEAAGSFYVHILSLQNQEARTYDRFWPRPGTHQGPACGQCRSHPGTVPQ